MRGAVHDGLLGDLLAELGPWVLGAVGVVLGRDGGEHVHQLVLVQPVLLGVGGDDHGVHRRRRKRASGAVAGRLGRRQALEAGVLHLFGSDRHGHVVGARCHRVGRGPQRLGPGGAEVLHPADGLARDLQRTGQGHAARSRGGGAEPVGVDVVLGDTGRREGVHGRVDDEVVDVFVPLARRRACSPCQ